jgi:hypothetical protein
MKTNENVLTRERQKQLPAVLGEPAHPVVNRRMAYAEKAGNVTDSNVAMV